MRKRRITKDNLIPFDKSRRVIRLDQRGPEKKSRRYAAGVSGALGIVCILYCLCIRMFMGYGTYFFLIWGVIGVLLGAFAWLLWRKDMTERIPRMVRRVFVGCLAVGALLLVVTEGMILGKFSARADAGADYCIVLGAQWKNDRPSYVLQQRLDAAVIYLQQNPDTYVIVSGGQGSNEVISEAEGMAAYLENAGIDAERIIQENQSTSTNENLVFSSEYLDKAEDRVVLVTNNYHMFRALKIARKKGYLRVQGLSAPSYPGMLPNNLLREFLGVWKDFLAGNI